MSSERVNRAKTHRAAEVVVVGQDQGLITEFFGAQQQLLQRRGPVVERIITVAMKFNVGHI